MRPKKIICYIGIILLTFMLCVMTTRGSDVVTKENDTVSEQDVLDYGVNLFNWEGIESLEEDLRSAMPEESSFDLKSEVQSMLNGEKRFTLENILSTLGGFLFAEVGDFVRIGARFVLIVLLCNLLQTLSSSFKTKETTKICFFVCYIVIILSAIESFYRMNQLALQTINHMQDIMLVCIPTLLAFMTTTGFVSSSVAMAPIIVSALNLCVRLITQLILPCMISVVILEMISTMSEQFKIDKMIKLFYKWAKWALRAVLILSVGILGIYRATLPYVDVTVKKTALKLTAAFIPVVGNATTGALEFIFSCTSLIKNTFAIGVILWIVVLVSLPMIKILSYIIVYQVAGALIEPLGDKKMATMATKLSKGCEFILSSVGIVAILCITVLVICMSVGGAT